MCLSEPANSHSQFLSFQLPAFHAPPAVLSSRVSLIKLALYFSASASCAFFVLIAISPFLQLCSGEFVSFAWAAGWLYMRAGGSYARRVVYLFVGGTIKGDGRICPHITTHRLGSAPEFACPPAPFSHFPIKTGKRAAAASAAAISRCDASAASIYTRCICILKRFIPPVACTSSAFPILAPRF